MWRVASFIDLIKLEGLKGEDKRLSFLPESQKSLLSGWRFFSKNSGEVNFFF